MRIIIIIKKSWAFSVVSFRFFALDSPMINSCLFHDDNPHWNWWKKNNIISHLLSPVHRFITRNLTYLARRKQTAQPAYRLLNDSKDVSCGLYLSPRFFSPFFLFFFSSSTKKIKMCAAEGKCWLLITMVFICFGLICSLPPSCHFHCKYKNGNKRITAEISRITLVRCSPHNGVYIVPTQSFNIEHQVHALYSLFTHTSYSPSSHRTSNFSTSYNESPVQQKYEIELSLQWTLCHFYLPILLDFFIGFFHSSAFRS